MIHSLSRNERAVKVVKISLIITFRRPSCLLSVDPPPPRTFFISPPPGIPTIKLSMPVAEVADMVFSLRDDLVSRTEARSAARGADAEATCLDTQEILTEELEERLRKHWPRKGRTEVDTVVDNLVRLLSYLRLQIPTALETLGSSGMHCPITLYECHTSFEELLQFSPSFLRQNGCMSVHDMRRAFHAFSYPFIPNLRFPFLPFPPLVRASLVFIALLLPPLPSSSPSHLFPSLGKLFQTNLTLWPAAPLAPPSVVLRTRRLSFSPFYSNHFLPRCDGHRSGRGNRGKGSYTHTARRLEG